MSEKSRYNGGKWTKNELQLWKNPVAALAAAVIRQWHEDGEPESSKEVIASWAAIYDEAISLNPKNP